MSDAVLFQVDGAVATLTLNRPACNNAINAAMARDVQRVMQDVARDREIRALFVTGAGRAFCAGLDDATTRLDPQECGDALASLRSSPVPIVMAVNGIAVGEGCSLALCGDLVLAAMSASFTLSSTSDGDSLSAAQAQRQGLINECLSDDDLLPRASELAHRLASGPTRALAMTRQLVDESLDSSFEAQYRRELEANQMLRESVDGREGVQAFLEKREAQFRGD